MYRLMLAACAAAIAFTALPTASEATFTKRDKSSWSWGTKDWGKCTLFSGWHDKRSHKGKAAK